MFRILLISLVFIAHPAFADTNLSDLECSLLIKKSADTDFSLKNLAGLYANRKCKDFKFDFTTLSKLEKQIFKVKFDEIEADLSRKEDSEENVDNLKKLFKLEKNKLTQFEYFKKIRQKYRTSGQKKASFNLIQKYYADLHTEMIKSKKNKEDLFNVFNEVSQIYAKALWNNDNPKKALVELDKAIKILDSKFPLYNLYLNKAKISEDQLLIDSALLNFDLSIKAFKNDSEKKISFDLAKVLWNKAWLMYQNSKPEVALVALKDIIDTATDPAEKTRAQFFAAKLYKKTNNETESKKLLNDNIQSDFFSFYAMASYKELNLKIPALTKSINSEKIEIDKLSSFLEPAERQFFLDLLNYQEIEMAEKATLILTKNNNDYVKLGLILAEKAQFFNTLFTGFAKSNITEKKELFSKYSKYLFPQVHTEKVTEMSRLTEVSKPLIYSIMKQESGFNPSARSPSNALGLMQVIPPLAKSLAKKYKIKDYKRNEDLYNPMVNIEMGVYELKEQLTKQKGQLSFVASAYNAGPNALKRWVQREPITDMFEFIENIPYDETRLYVKIIARNMLFYQRLGQPDQEHDFPDDFIKIVPQT